MHRRDALAGAGALLAGLAGCLSGEDSPEGETDRSDDGGSGADGDDTTTPDGGTTSPGPDPVDSVALDALLPAVVETTSPDSIGVEGDEDRQYLYLRVSAATDADAPAADDFAFAFAGGEYERKRYEDEFDHWRGWASDDEEYTAETGEGWLLFELPATADDPAPATLRWPGGEWTADETLRARLASPHSPTAVSVSVPDTVAPGDQPTLSATLTNEGDLPASVPVAVNRVGPDVAYAPLTAGRPTVPAGETVTWEWTDDGVDLTVDGRGATYHVHWPGGDADGDVEATEETTAAGLN